MDSASLRDPTPALLDFFHVDGRGGMDSASLRDPTPALLDFFHVDGRGGIRTHAGLHPHDFQSCALSRSATRPEFAVGCVLTQAGTEGVGWAPQAAPSRGSTIPPFARYHLRPLGSNHTLRVRSNGDSSPATEGVGLIPLRSAIPPPNHRPLPCDTEGVGFEPTRAFRPNALAGRRLKPLGHPSQVAPPGFEPGLS
jgi:hypothetical protein